MYLRGGRVYPSCYFFNYYKIFLILGKSPKKKSRSGDISGTGLREILK
jgi:hypothetical protein